MGLPLGGFMQIKGTEAKASLLMLEFWLTCPMDREVEMVLSTWATVLASCHEGDLLCYFLLFWGGHPLQGSRKEDGEPTHRGQFNSDSSGRMKDRRLSREPWVSAAISPGLLTS